MAKKQRIIKLPRSIRRLFPKVTSAIDAHSPVSITVNAKDCDTAKRLDPTECALAHAAKRQFHADGVIIGMSASYVIKGNKAVRFHTPESVRREIVSFDRHSDFEKGTYILPPKSPSLRFGEPPRPGRKGGNHQSKRKLHKSARIRVLSRGA